jgi:type I restriction enzyme M protein
MRHDYSSIFDDFLTFSMCAFALKTEEETYLERAKRYQPEEMKLFSELLAELMRLYGKCDTWTDPLGTFYECISSNYKKSGFGQYFTPEPVCDMMVTLQMPETGSPETVNDPACGSGRLLLACHFQSKGKVRVYAEDLDEICVKMTCLNLLFHGAVGEVVHHNSIMPDHWFNGWVINHKFKTLGFPSILRIRQDQSEIMKNRMSRPENVPEKPTIVPQLSFDF